MSPSVMEMQKLVSNMGQITLILWYLHKVVFFLVIVLVIIIYMFIIIIYYLYYYIYIMMFRKLARKIKSITHSQRSTPDTDQLMPLRKEIASFAA